MGILKSAFNAAARIHSRPAWIKRPGSPDLYTAMRMTPSQYFRYLAGPSQTVVTGSECIIPVATIFGQQSATITMDAPPSAGAWTISFVLNGTPVTTGSLDFHAAASDIQDALRLIAGCENVETAGNLVDDGFTTINFIGVKQVENVSIDSSGLTGVATVTITYTPIAWPDPLIKRGDRIINTDGTFTAVEVIVMPDIGGAVMGYRVRYD